MENSVVLTVKGKPIKLKFAETTESESIMERIRQMMQMIELPAILAESELQELFTWLLAENTVAIENGTAVLTTEELQSLLQRVRTQLERIEETGLSTYKHWKAEQRRKYSEKTAV